jgi:hypothetical protein
MSSLATSALTIMGGLTIFVVGQFILKILIEPAHELKKAVGEVRFNLAFHAATIRTPAAKLLRASITRRGDTALSGPVQGLSLAFTAINQDCRAKHPRPFHLCSWH